MDISHLTEYLGSAAVGFAGVAAWGAVAPSSQLWGPTIRHVPGPGTLALTFDDGPNPSVTPKLLQLLERYGARATFFLIGRFVREDQLLAREIARRGHCVGNHTDTHPSLVFLPPQEIAEQLRRCDEAIENATGAAPEWMRPPYGFRSPFLGSVVRKNGGKGIVMWSRMARDWAPQSPGPVIRRLQRARGGDIVLLHDGDHRVSRGDREHTLKALEHWLPLWKDSGLRFVTLDEFGQDELSSEPPIQARRTS